MALTSNRHNERVFAMAVGPFVRHDRTMHYDVAYPDADVALDVLGAYFADAATLRVGRAERCAVCRTPAAPVRSSDAEIDAWLTGWSHRMGHAWSAESDDADLTALPALVEMDAIERRRRIADSQLDAVIGIPTTIFVAIAAELTEDEEVFVTDDLVLAACAVCRYSPHARRETSRTVLGRFIAERFGNRAAFEDAKASRTIAPILALLDRAARDETA